MAKPKKKKRYNADRMREPSGGAASRVGRNTLALFITTNLTSLLSFFITILLTRKLGVESFGQYSLLVSWVAILGSFSDMGFNILSVRDIARKKELTVPYLTQVMVLRFAFSSVYYLILVALGFLLGYEPLLKIGLAVLGGRFVIDATGGAYIYLLQAHERMGRQGLFMLASTAVRLIGVLAALHLGGGVLAVCAVWVVVSLLTLLAMVADAARRGWVPQFQKYRTAQSIQMVKAALPFAVVGALQMMYYRADSILLKSLAGNGAVGYYNAAGSILQYVYLIAQLFSVSLLPVLSSSIRADTFLRVLMRSVKAVLFLAFPITVGGFLLAGPIIRWLYGIAYVPSAPLLAVLLLSATPFYLTLLVFNVLSVRQPIRLAWLYAFLLVVNVGLNFLWIPGQGPTGAAWARVASEYSGMVLGISLMLPYLKRSPVRLVWPIMASFLSALLMGAIIRLDPRLYWIALGPAIYFTALWFFRALGPEDWKSLRSIIGRYQVAGNS